MKNLPLFLVQTSLFFGWPYHSAAAQITPPLLVAELKCSAAVSNTIWQAPQANSKVKIGSDDFPEIAYLSNKYLADFGEVLDSAQEPAEIVCQIGSDFSNLNFAFGLDRNNKVTDREDIVLVEIYVGEELLKQSYVRLGQVYAVSVPLKGIQQISIKAQCLRPEWWNNCPRLSFTEIRLE